MTDKEVYTNASGFLVAWNETTSILLAYTSYLLALNSDIQEKLQSEIGAYFEDKLVSLYTLPLVMACTTVSTALVMVACFCSLMHKL